MGDDTELEKQIKEILMEFGGAASMCWTRTPDGIFDSTQVTSFSQQALTQVQKIMEGK